MAPRVRAPCVLEALRRATRDGQDPQRLAKVAERAERSPRTLNRILEYGPGHYFTLEQADRLLTAAGSHLDLDCTASGDIVE